MRVFWAIAAAAIVVGFLAAGPLIARLATGEINARFPPRSSEDVRAAAVRASSNDLEAINKANVALSLSAETVRPLVEAAVRAAVANEELNLDAIEVRLGEQTIDFSAGISGLIKEAEATVTGTASGIVSVASQTADIVVTPALDRIQIASIDIAGFRLPGGVARATGEALTAFIANVNGKIEPIRIDTPATILEAKELKLGSRTVAVPAHHIAGASILVEPKRLAWIAELTAGSAAAPGPNLNSGPAADFASFAAAFADSGGPLLAGLGNDGLALDPGLVSAILGELAPPNPAARAEASLAAAWREAHLLAGPDLSLALPAKDYREIVEPLLRTGLQKAASEAGIVLSDIHTDLLPGALNLEATGAVTLGEPIDGTARIRVVVSASPSFAGARLEVLPGLVGLEILSAEAADPKLTGLLTAINGALAGFAHGLDGTLPKLPVEIDPVEVAAIDLKSAAAKTPGLTLTPDVVPASSIVVERGAALLTPLGLKLLADLATPSKSLAPRPSGVGSGPMPADTGAIEAYFDTRAGSPPPGVPVNTSRIGVSWKRVAELVNAHWAELGGVGVRYRLDTGVLPMESTPIELVKKPTYSCDQNWDCPFESCADSCRLDSCSWHCDEVCTKIPEFRGIKVTFKNRCVLKDPLCETNKVACRAGRDAKYGACQLACNAEANADVAACQAKANLKKAGCDTGRAVQEAASHVGGIGRIGGDARAAGSLATSVSALQLTTDRPGISFVPELSGSLDITGSITFTPYDIGHVLVCPAKGKTPFETHAAVPAQRPTVSASLAADPAGPRPDHPGELALLGKVEPFTVNATIRPAPLDALVTQNPQIVVICNPVLSAVLIGLTIFGDAEGVAGTDIIRALAGNEVAAILTGDVEYDVKNLEFPLRIAPIGIEFGKRDYRLLPSLTDSAIWFSLSPG